MECRRAAAVAPQKARWQGGRECPSSDWYGWQRTVGNRRMERDWARPERRTAPNQGLLVSDYVREGDDWKVRMAETNTTWKVSHSSTRLLHHNQPQRCLRLLARAPINPQRTPGGDNEKTLTSFPRRIGMLLATLRNPKQVVPATSDVPANTSR